jgi:hypothetical protein
MDTLGTLQSAWSVLRASAGEVTALDLTSAGDFAHKPATAVEIVGGATETPVNGIEIAFSGTDANNETFSYKVYAYRKTNGPATLVCSGAGTLGTQAVLLNPSTGATATNTFWADTLTCTSVWPATVTLSDSGNNGVARLTFDLLGYSHIYVEITNADGTTGVEAASVAAWYAGY